MPKLAIRSLEEDFQKLTNPTVLEKLEMHKLLGLLTTWSGNLTYNEIMGEENPKLTGQIVLALQNELLRRVNPKPLAVELRRLCREGQP